MQKSAWYVSQICFFGGLIVLVYQNLCLLIFYQLGKVNRRALVN